MLRSTVCIPWVKLEGELFSYSEIIIIILRICLRMQLPRYPKIEAIGENLQSNDDDDDLHEQIISWLICRSGIFKSANRENRFSADQSDTKQSYH